MSMMESALYSGLNRGGCSLMGEDITPTLISRYETQIGNTQDKLNVLQQPTVYNGVQVTSPINASNPKPGDPCHSLTNDNRNYLVEGNMDAVVRRLTPLECERLQGYPDHWTDIGEWTDTKGKKHKDADSPRYKALGNSIALPFWEWMAKRMVSHLDTEQPTMASLFDGISGFPLVYARAGVETKWTSEIEEFPIAVCKKHFGDEDTGEVGDYEKYL